MATDQGSSNATSGETASIGTGTYTARLTRASQPARDQAAKRRAAAEGVIPNAVAAWPTVRTEEPSRSNLLSCSRDVALMPARFIRFILSELTSLPGTFLRSKGSSQVKGLVESRRTPTRMTWLSSRTQ